MTETMNETELAATVRMSGPAPRATGPADRSATHGTESGTTTRRSLPPGALRSDHVDVSGAPRRDPRRLLTACGVILGLLALGLVLRPWLAPATAARETVAVLEITHGTVELRAADGGQVQSRLLPLAGTEIPAGTVIETGAGDPGGGTGGAPGAVAVLAGAAADDSAASHAPPGSGRAALRLAGGASLRLDVDTRVRMASESSLVLERGAVYVDTGDRGDEDEDARVEVRTTLGVVRDVGTQFEVRLVPGGDVPGTAETPLRVRVREGTVQLRRADVTHAAGAGEMLEVRGDGTVTRHPIPVYGPHWDWVLETAPPPEIDGLPLRAFLDWYAREGGWSLRFADPGLAERVASTVLHGTADGLTPGQAASMVLRGSGLQARLEEGVLWVEASAL